MSLKPCEMDLGIDGVGMVRVRFPEPVREMALTPAMARDLAHKFWELAREADRQIRNPVPPLPGMADQDPLDRPRRDG